MKKIYIILFLIILFMPKFVLAKINNVAFISQVLPGNWDETLNCGQTSYYMTLSYLNDIKDEEKLDYNEIKKIDDWLNKEYGDPINNYNGYYTTTEKLKNLAEKRDGLKNIYISYGVEDFDKIKTEIDDGNIVTVLVRAGMTISKGGHFMILIGYDDEYVYFNDPGKMLGRKRKYLKTTFFKSWKTQNYEYLVIKKEEKKESNNSKMEIKEDGKLKDGVLLNETIKDGNNILTTVIKNNNNKLQIITVDAEMEDYQESADILDYGYGKILGKFEDDNSSALNGTVEKEEFIGFATEKMPVVLDENNWLHVAEDLIIDYNTPKNILEENNEDWKNICDYGYGENGELICIVENGNEGYGYGGEEEIENNDGEEDDNGYGYGDENNEDAEIDVGYGYGNETQEEIYNLDFEFYNNYRADRLIIPLSWKALSDNDLNFSLDYKINNGEWKKVFEDLNLLNYDFYARYNNSKYTFRIKSSYKNQYSSYVELSQDINLIPKANLSYLWEINEDTVLGENNTYFCYSCSLGLGKTLLVEKNVTIKMQKDAIFDVYGDVIMMGEKDKNISILSDNELYNGGNWGSINFNNNKFVELNYVSIGYGGYTSFIGSSDMVKANNAQNLIINNSYFYNGMHPFGNLSVVVSNIKIANSKFSDSTSGITIVDSIGEVFNNEFTNNLYNVVFESVYGDLSFYNNKILNARSHAVIGNNIFAKMQDNIFENNKNNLISMHLLNLDKGEETLSKNIYSICTANIASGATLTIESGTIFKSYTNCGLFFINGEIKIGGGVEPVVFTSYYDDGHGGDTNSDGNMSIPHIGDWGYLEFSESSSGTIDNAIFKYGGYHYLSSSNHGMVFINGASGVEIKNSSFENGFFWNIESKYANNIDIINNNINGAANYGIKILCGSNITIKNNKISNAGLYGILSTANESVINEGNVFENNMYGDITYSN